MAGIDLDSPSIYLSGSTRLGSLPTESFRLGKPSSFSQFVAVLENFGVPGPIHLDRSNLENIRYYKRIGSGSQFIVFKSIVDGVFRGQVIKRAQVQGSDFEDSNGDNESQQLKLRIIDLEIRTLCDERVRQSPHIVSLDGWGFDYSDRKELNRCPFLLVQEALCSLGDFLRNPAQFHVERVCLEQKYTICLDIASGLECLRQCGIVHGDLKPDNILLFYDKNREGRYMAKLADFGLSIFTTQNNDLSFSDYRSTPHWQPPETVSAGRYENIEPDQLFKCDSYSYGLLALSTLALGNAKSPLGNSEQRDAESIQDEIDCALASSRDLTVAERKDACKYSKLIFKHFVVDSPLGRSFVSPELLEDVKSQAYTAW